VPQVFPLAPAESLDARLVVVKLTNVPTHDHASLGRRSLDRIAMEERVRNELVRQLREVVATGSVELRGHGSITVAGRSLVGFSVRVSSLDAESSVAVQAHGHGGKRRMGCGIFRPTRGT
jgi:CRISPR-associated protein Cas6